MLIAGGGGCDHKIYIVAFLLVYDIDSEISYSGSLQPHVHQVEAMPGLDDEANHRPEHGGGNGRHSPRTADMGGQKGSVFGIEIILEFWDRTLVIFNEVGMNEKRKYR
jgi:hypothetical protein